MCGICGEYIYREDARVDPELLRRMTRVLSHRGPDGEGVLVQGNIGLGHRRLSIIDLQTGGQPIANEDETIWIVFNGEIYNFQELREGLVRRGHVFRSKSDTEVILHLYEEQGPECVRQLRGMFAFAIWDSTRQRLFLARDRVGIKPLYYCRTSRSLCFASELKAILEHPSVGRDVDLPALRKFLAFQYVPGEDTLFQGIRKLLPGHYLVAEQGKVTLQRYWDLSFTRQRWSLSFEEAAEELHGLLRTTVRDHMIADVPVGILLSGGVDSSAVLSFAVQNTGQKVNTFTVGFDGDQVIDERPYARMSSERFGTDHHEMSISARDFSQFLPSYVWHMEEPVCEPPAVALYYVSRFARSHVKVLLSGEGGDEAFAGYPNYPNMLLMDRIQRMLGALARPAGEALSLAGRVAREARLQRYGYALGRPLSEHYFSRTSGPTAFFNRQAGQLFTPEFLESTSSVSAAGMVAGLTDTVKSEPLLNQMLYVDTKTWLPDDLLVKADKMTMANSLELRVPLLDHVLLEFAASLPPDYKVRDQETKRVLKAAFARELPAAILQRKKAGFPVPYGDWLNGELKDYAFDLLTSQRAAARGLFRRDSIESLLTQSGTNGGLAKEVFSLMVVELWYQQFADRSPAASARCAVGVS